MITKCWEVVRYGSASVWAELSDGTTEKLFEYYVDELSIEPSELIGLTPSQAIGLKHDRDVAYLRS